MRAEGACTLRTGWNADGVGPAFAEATADVPVSPGMWTG